MNNVGCRIMLDNIFMVHSAIDWAIFHNRWFHVEPYNLGWVMEREVNEQKTKTTY